MEENNKNDESAVNILLNISSDLFIDQINFNTDNCEIDTNEKILSCKLNENWNDQDVNVKSIFSWTSEEEAIIIREYRKNPKKYAEKAKEYLFGRSKGAIIKRWNNVLKKNHPNLIIKNNVSWTPDEDEIIIREYKKNPTNFVKNASQYLLGRTDSAVGSRWKNVLRKKHYPNLITKKYGGNFSKIAEYTWKYSCNKCYKNSKCANYFKRILKFKSLLLLRIF